MHWWWRLPENLEGFIPHHTGCAARTCQRSLTTFCFGKAQQVFAFSFYGIIDGAQASVLLESSTPSGIKQPDPFEVAPRSDRRIAAQIVLFLVIFLFSPKRTPPVTTRQPQRFRVRPRRARVRAGRFPRPCGPSLKPRRPRRGFTISIPRAPCALPWSHGDPAVVCRPLGAGAPPPRSLSARHGRGRPRVGPPPTRGCEARPPRSLSLNLSLSPALVRRVLQSAAPIRPGRSTSMGGPDSTGQTSLLRLCDSVPPCACSVRHDPAPLGFEHFQPRTQVPRHPLPMSLGPWGICLPPSFLPGAAVRAL